MNKLISFCGLNCEKCEARIATINNDDQLRSEVAKNWSNLNGVEITKEMINCLGCRMDGVKTPFCDKLCPIRKFALEKHFDTCGNCKNLKLCEKVGVVINNNKEAYNNMMK